MNDNEPSLLMKSMATALQVRNLVKRYPGVTAVDGVSFGVETGICFGLLGPNGAGKTTTIEIMEGILKPTSGEVLYRGEPLGPRFRDEAGIQFQFTALQDFLTVREHLNLFRKLYETGPGVDELIDLCSLREFHDRDARKLSGGQRQRLLLAIALVNDPAVVFLDEPTTGLDPQSRANLWTHVRRLRDDLNTTVFLTTHYLDEADALCDRILIIDFGRIVAEGTPEELKHRISGDLVTIELNGDRDPVAALAALGDIEGIRGTSMHAGTLRVNVDAGGQQLMGIMRALDAAGVSIASIQLARPTLDDVFLTLTGRSLRDDSPASRPEAADAEEPAADTDPDNTIAAIKDNDKDSTSGTGGPR